MPTWILYLTLASSVLVAALLSPARRFGRGQRRDDSGAESVGGGRAPGEPTAERDESGAETAEGNDAHRLAGRPIHILVVDDDPNLRALLRTSFEVADIEVDEADSAKSAAAKIASRHPDVIVLDVSMPGMDGITFCRGLKADPFTRAIPVVLLTGDPTSEKVGREAGADAFLRKPFSPLELLTLSERLGKEPA